MPLILEPGRAGERAQPDVMGGGRRRLIRGKNQVPLMVG